MRRVKAALAGQAILFRAADAEIEAALLGTEIAVFELRERGAETDGALALSVVGWIGLGARRVRPAAHRARTLARDAGVWPALDPLHRIAFHIVESPRVGKLAAHGFRLLVGVVEIPEIPV